MSDTTVAVSRSVHASAADIFELIADPARQPEWDGNDNLATAKTGQRVRAVGDVFETTLTTGSIRRNTVIEFDEGRRIAWRPSEVDSAPPGHVWRWELEPLDDRTAQVSQTYDWSKLDPADEGRQQRARRTGERELRASLDRLATLAESRRG